MSSTPSDKGDDGEIRVGLEFATLDRRIYHDIHNVTVSVKDGTTQIDHVIISRFGIFVVETKNRSGLIYGRERDKNWLLVKSSGYPGFTLRPTGGTRNPIFRRGNRPC